MAETPRLDLPYLSTAQAQKEVMHNIALDRLDLLVQCAVLDRNLSTPPGSPADGAAYIVGTSPTGVWAGHANDLALYVNLQWEFIAPLPGFQAWVNDESVLVYWSGAAWVIASGGGGSTTFLGLTDTPDTYAGQAGKALLVNPSGTALEFGASGGGAPVDATYIVSSANTTLSAERVLTDSPRIAWNTATAGQVSADIPTHAVQRSHLEALAFGYLLGRGNPPTGDVEAVFVGAGLQLTAGTLSLSSAPGAADFLSLTDTPDSYAGQAGKAVLVNAGATALEFGTATGGGLTTEDVQDTVSVMFPTSASLDFTYNDTAGTIAAEVRFGGVTENHLSFSDTTADDASTGQHGLLPKLSGSATQYLNGTGTWTTPPIGGSSEWTRTPAPPDLSTSLIAFWRLEEASGNRIDSVNAIAMVPTGTPGNSAGKTGNAVSFTTATNTYLAAADSALLSAGANQSFTVAAWIYFNGALSGSRGVFGKGNASIIYNQVEYLLGTSGTTLVWYVGSGSSYVNLGASGLTLAGSTWYFVVAWYDADADTQYIQVNNGTPSSVANAAGSFDSNGPAEIGRQPQVSGGTPFDGRIDNVMFWKRTLSTSERTALYNSGNGVDYPLPATVATLTTATAGDQVLLSSSAGSTTERLEVNSGIKVGNSTGTVDGIVRWTGTDMEVRKGGAWGSLTQNLTLPLAVAQGGTGATDDAGARAALGLGTMATQNANAVAITGGTVSLGGHAPTGVLDVQGSVVASDAATEYYSTRLWPVAPAGATNATVLRIEPATGPALAATNFRGLLLCDQPTMATVYGLALQVSAGTGRYNINATGTAANYFGGTVQVVGNVGIGTAPISITPLFISWDKNNYQGAIFKPFGGTDDGSGNSIYFQNSAGTAVGSIKQTSTATAYNTTSDARLKHSITPLTDALTTLLALRPVRWKWNADDSPGEGFLAHELMVPCPLAVSGLPDEVNEDGSVKPQQVDASKLVAVLVGAVQTLAARVQALEEALGV
jgi:hypothetical protein